MKHEEFQKLKNNVSEKTFYNNYKGFSKLSKFLSYVGNLFSILFAYFFLIEIASATLIDPSTTTVNLVIMGVVSVLVMVELSKRFIFDKFSQSFIKDKFKLKNSEVKILGLLSVGLIAISFYFSLNGAQKYADKDDALKDNVTANVTEYKDSLTTLYNVKIAKIETLNEQLYKSNHTYDSTITLYESQYLALGTGSWQERQEKSRIKSILTEKKNDKKDNSLTIDKNDVKIKTIIKDRNIEILAYEESLNKKVDSTIEKNSSNPFIFITFSTVIELLILFGVYFINYFEVRSLGEYEEKIKKDPRFKQFSLWNGLISSLYSSGVQTGDTLPFKTEMMKLFKANAFEINTKEFDDALRMFTHLEILKKKGNKKAINMTEQEARDKIRAHFKIE